MSDIPPPHNHLKHLVRCNLCFQSDSLPDQYMSIKQMSHGKKNVDNYGAWYMKCLSNPGPCKGFNWIEMPRGVCGDTIRCPGLLCLQRLQPRQGSNSCHIGLCSPCCVLAHQKTQNLPHCPAHHKAFLKEAQPPTAQHLLTPPSLPRPDSFSHPLSDVYRTRLRDLDTENLERVSSQAEGRSYARQAAKVVTVSWWMEDGAHPDTIDVAAPAHPYFHPIQAPDLVTLYAVDKDLFETFDRAQDIWKIGSANTPAQFVEKDVVLLYRTRGVKSGIGMPMGSLGTLNLRDARRIPSDIMVFTAAPSTPNGPVIRQPNFADSAIYNIDSPFEQGSSAFYSASPTLQRLPSTSSSSYQTHYSTPCDSLLSHTSFSAYTPSPQVAPPAAAKSVPAIPSVSTPELEQPPSATITSAISVSPSLALTDTELRQIVLSATRGASKTGWPFIETRAMAAGFLLMDRRRDTPTARNDNFRDAFGSDFVSSTYHDNRGAWDRACSAGVKPSALITENDTSRWRKFRAPYWNNP
ncbi:hypothetical protein B0H15DRAFT_1026888 [Mycena belliarum]|uniref:Uncharacterized protein n=1 Tax=Mycena belliarum TaxID=1033014 RepID=A0AAD6TR00_9AGAR|nr:hypothetical protein B0H15DRAFT_1026888 [Mycena belliae]